MAGLVQRIKRIWVTLGIVATVVFTAWCLIAYYANEEGRRAALGDARVSVEHAGGSWLFIPRTHPSHATGLLFYAGALVDPRAYARMAHRIADAGYPVVIVELPRRGAFGGAEGSPVLARGRAAMASLPAVRCWIIGGHSRGGEVASRHALADPGGSAALLLVATSHPRDIDLSPLALPVTKVVGDRDGLATPERVARNRHRLPAHTRWIDVRGANHSQFGDYGFQPGDGFAQITREQQQGRLVEETRRLLASTSAAPACLSPAHPR